MNNLTVKCDYCGNKIYNYKGNKSGTIECDICHDEFYEEERHYQKKINKKQKKAKE